MNLLSEVNIYVDGKNNLLGLATAGTYHAVLEDVRSGKERYITKSFDRDTTPIRLMLLAALEAVDQLKRPCAIKIYSATQLGLLKKGGLHQGLAEELLDTIRKAQHTYTYQVNAYLTRKHINKYKMQP
jgi:ribonuclease HI